MLRVGLVLALVLSAALDAWADPTFDAGSNNRGTTVSSLTLSHTTSGTNRFLICFYAVNDATPQAVTGATYNGVAMTRIGTEISPDGFFTFAGLFRLIAPATGTHDVVLSTAGGTNGRFYAACASYTDVHQTTATGALTTRFDQNHASPISEDISSAAGERVVDGAILYGSAVQLSVGAGQTLRAENYNGGNGDDVAISDEPGAGTVTMSWTHGAATPTYAYFAVPLKPVAGGGGGGSRNGPLLGVGP